MVHPQPNTTGTVDVYFDTRARGIEAARYPKRLLPPENLLTNANFADAAKGLPVAWQVRPTALARLGRFAHTTGMQSLKIVVDESTPRSAGRDVTIAQRIDVREIAGQEMVFECDLFAERALYGAPVCVELQQFRADESRIPECAIEPRWLTLELAQGQLVQFRERGRFSPEAASVNVHFRVRCSVRDADTWQFVSGPESFFTVWLDRVVVRPGERWPWPAASNAGFVQGARETAPLNRGFEFTGQRRLAFNGASEGTLTSGRLNPNPESVHWGVQRGTLEFWCRPSWNANDGVERIFFTGFGYLYRLQSQLRKLRAEGENHLEFAIADSNRRLHRINGPAPLRAGHWHHIAATWDLPKAHLQLFVDGQLVGAEGPGPKPWASTRAPNGPKKLKGIGISATDKRSVPMQAFIGGRVVEKKWPPRDAAEAVLDEFRISDSVRYTAAFQPAQQEFVLDENTRALFHFENESYGVHDSDDGFVRGYLACELPPQEETVLLATYGNDRIECREVVLRPHAPEDLFEANRGESRLPCVRPVRALPDPRFIDYRERYVERIVDEDDDGFTLEVGGDLEPLMRSATFELADGAHTRTTRLPRWRANDNVVPLSVESIGATLAADVAGDADKAIEVFRHALLTGDYYDAHYCETLPNGRHRSRVSYTFLKALNVYPFDQCGPQNYTVRKLFLAAGISSNDAPGTHHQFQQAFYHGGWRLFDLAARNYWLNRDNETLLGLRGLGDDPYLRLRGSTVVNSYFPGQPSSARFGSPVRPHSMDFPLRPGERVSLCWHNEGRWFEVTGNRRAISLARIPPYFGNGAILYEPTAEGEAATFDNLSVEVMDDGSRLLRAESSAKASALIYRTECPYIFSDAQVRGKYRASAPDTITLSLSFDHGKRWHKVWSNSSKAGAVAADLRKRVTGRYAYWLRLKLARGSGATVAGLRVRTVFVHAPRSLPGKLSLGKNRISFVGGPVTVAVKSACSWVERHRAKLGVSLNAISWYDLDSEEHRNLFVAAPGKQARLQVTLEGERIDGQVCLERLPAGWQCTPKRRTVKVDDPARPVTVDLALEPGPSAVGTIHCVDVVVRSRETERRIPAQILVAAAPLVRDAQDAEEVLDGATPMDVLELSGGRCIAFKGEGAVAFDLDAPTAGKYALWLHARWDVGSAAIQPASTGVVPPAHVSAPLSLRIDDASPRTLLPYGMRGFRNWTGPGYA
ncbi:LamG domain-containing protein, partial [PVC group bacterium]|nr:LamG domain-containing protein [PVC group bacterium]